MENSDSHWRFLKTHSKCLGCSHAVVKNWNIAMIPACCSIFSSHLIIMLYVMSNDYVSHIMAMLKLYFFFTFICKYSDFIT